MATTQAASRSSRVLMVRPSGLRCQAMKAVTVHSSFNMGKPTPMVRRVHALPESVIHMDITSLAVARLLVKQGAQNERPEGKSAQAVQPFGGAHFDVALAKMP